MTTKTQTIDQLIKLSTRIAEAWIKKPGNAGNAMASKAILAVCKHLSHQAGYRFDIAELIRLCQAATKGHDRGCARFCVNGQSPWGMSPIVRQHNVYQETRST